MSAEITKITGIGFASVMNDKPLYCVLCTVIFIDALKKCAVALMLISHFIVDEDWKLSCWETYSTSFLAARRKKPFVPMKTEQNGGKCDNQVAKRQRERHIPPVWHQMRGEGWQRGWRGSDEGPKGEKRLMKWLQDRENTRRRWML